MLLTDTSILNFAHAETGWFGTPNVFFLDADPVRAAQAHCDAHVARMPATYAGLLSSTWHGLHNPRHAQLEALEQWEAANRAAKVVWEPATGAHPLPVFAPPSVGTGGTARWLLYGLPVPPHAYGGHPCAVWLLEGAGNYRWLWRCAMALVAEYRSRYQRMHSEEPALWALEPEPPAYAAAGTRSVFTEPPVVAPIVYRITNTDKRGNEYYDAVESYRRFYAAARPHLRTYSTRAAPSWMRTAAA